MPILLKLKQTPAPPAAPIDASCLCPDRLAGRERPEVERLPIFVGRSRVPLGDLFEVSGDGGEAIEVEGDLSSFSRVGASMSCGRVVVRGAVGPWAAAGMSGGTFLVEGPAGDHAGEGRTRGLLRIQGAAGEHPPAPPPGNAPGSNPGANPVARARR